MSNAIAPEFSDSKHKDALNPVENVQVKFWLLLCYLGPQGITIRSVLLTSQEQHVLLDIQGWFKNEGQPLADYEIETHRELVWVIRSELLTADDDLDEELRSLRKFAMDVMCSDIEDKLGGKPHWPFPKANRA